MLTLFKSATARLTLNNLGRMVINVLKCIQDNIKHVLKTIISLSFYILAEFTLHNTLL